jgi:D-serine deaminase-like pyridoxal phosphate-dependent protein
MVEAGIPGVLLTSPIMDHVKIARMVRLARDGEVMLSVGDRRQVELLGEAAAANNVRLDLLVDLDVVDGRTGATPGKPALEVAQLVDRHPSLRLRGLQAYAGRASHTKGFERRQMVSRQALAKAVETRDLLQRSGLDASILSGGSTGTYNIASGVEGVTELQVGSYIFMDVDYMAIGGADGREVYDDFQPSLTVLATVVSAPRPDRVTIDAGLKAFAPSPDPVVKGLQGFTYRRFGDEFGALSGAEGTQLPRLGDRLELIVPHCDPTVALYDEVYVVRNKIVQEAWPIVARREYRRG